MYVFGGAKYPSEEIVDELWALDLHSRVWTPIFNRHPVITEPDNTSMLDSGNILSMVAFQSNKEGLLPLPVRSHTAHVVGSVMIVLFGLSSRTKTSISYVQEYNYGESRVTEFAMPGPCTLLCTCKPICLISPWYCHSLICVGA